MGAHSAPKILFNTFKNNSKIKHVLQKTIPRRVASWYVVGRISPTFRRNINLHNQGRKARRASVLQGEGEICSSETSTVSDLTARLYVPDESASNPTNNSSFIFYTNIRTTAN